MYSNTITSLKLSAPKLSVKGVPKNSIALKQLITSVQTQQGPGPNHIHVSMRLRNNSRSMHLCIFEVWPPYCLEVAVKE